MADARLKLLVFGAHPDDCDLSAGGTAALYRRHGHQVKFVSVTNGESGHHLICGPELAEIRRREAAAAGAVCGIEYDVLSNRDGYLQPTVQARLEIIRIIRSYNPDLILTHRPNDYHPDHRYTSQLVCDAAYMVTVPPVAPEVPALRVNPIIAYLPDYFEKPYPHSATVVVDVEPVVDDVVAMLDCHASQFYEWLPYNQRKEDEVPADSNQRRTWLKEQYLTRIARRADRNRDLLVATYGERGHQMRAIEAFEPCEYGSPLDDAAIARLFPFIA